MANVKIRIESGADVLNKEQEAQKAKDEKKRMAVITLVAQQAVANAKKVLNYGISNIGNFTGDYTKTERIQYAVGIAGDLASIAVGASAGKVGAIVAVAGVAISRGLEAVSIVQDERHRKIESDYLRERSGNNLTNGSRGTEG